MLLTGVLLGCWSIGAIGQGTEQQPDAESLIRATCAAAGVDVDRTADEMSRAEQRALRRCTRDAEREMARADSESDADGEEIVCRRERVTGSHFPVRVCMTRSERAALQESSQERMRDRLNPRGGAGATDTQ